MNAESNNLGWKRTFNLNLGGLGSVSVTGSFELVVGWRVFVNSNAMNQTADHLDVTYAPFAWGWTNALVQGNTYPAIGFYNSTLEYVRAYAPISLKIFNSGKVCYQGQGVVLPVNLGTGLSAALKGCQAEVLTDIIDQVPISLGCNYSEPFNMTHLNISFT